MENDAAIIHNKPGPEQLADEYLKALLSLGEESSALLKRHIASIIQSSCSTTLEECAESFLLIMRNTNNAAPTLPGIYLKLSHGRTPCDLDMDDWGDDGPWIGPIDWIHFTYQTEFQIGFVNDKEYWSGSAASLPPSPLYFHNDCIYLDGIHYGQWDIMSIPRFSE